VFVSLALVVALLVSMSVAAPLGADGLPGELVQPAVFGVDLTGDESTRLVFVELELPPMVAEAGGTTLAALETEQASFLTQAARAGLQIQERYRYSRLFNGFSLEVRGSDLQALAKLPGVKAVWPVLQYHVPDLHTSLDMIGAVQAQVLGYDGTGVLVAVIDTGIDYNHPDLGGGWGNRVVGGWDFVGDDFDAGDPGRRTPVPDPDPMDPNGHGTHVAGIIGANGTVKGVAPGVSFLALKVFGRAGSTTADVILAALEMALEEGAHVVNMSLGAAFQWPQYPTAVAADLLVEAGVVVVCSQGNNGTQGLFAGGAPAVGSKVLAVASFDNTHMYLPYFEAPQGTPRGYITMSFSPPLPTEGTSPEVVYVGLGNTEADYAGKDVSGKVVLASRGDMSFAHKEQMARERGAVALLIHNNAPGLFSGTLGAPGTYIPTAGISQADGQALAALIGQGPVRLIWTNERASFPNPTGGLISGFSSWGPTPDLNLKPDLGAPGGSIYSTYPLAMGGYATLSGTSMSAPHVAGAVALLLEAEPSLTPQQVADRFRNTAVPRLHTEGQPWLLSVHRQGAGMIDVLAALNATGTVTPSQVSLGAVTGPRTFVLTVENRGKTAVTYTVSHTPALTTNHAIMSPGLSTAYGSATFPGSIVVEAGSQGTLEVTVTPPTATDRIFGGYIVLTPDDGSPVLRVPYLAFHGDYNLLPALAPGAHGMPWLAELVGSQYFQRASLSISPPDGERAYVLFHLQRQARKVQIEVLEDGTNRSHGLVLDADYVARNSTTTGFFAFEWDGTAPTGPVPAGTYRLRLTALRPLGDPENPAHWDTWTSGPITVTQYILEVEVSGSGTVTRSPEQDVYAPGQEVALTAQPAVGWTFSHWEGDLTGSDNPATIAMDGDKTVTAVFTQLKYTLGVAVTGQGTVTADPDLPEYVHGTQVTLRAVPAVGWGFSHWEGDLTGSDNPATLILDGDKTVTAVFTESEYSLTVTVTGQGSVRRSPDAPRYMHGTTVKLTAVPAVGWKLTRWEGDLTGDGNPATVIMDADKSVTAVFVAVTPAVAEPIVPPPAIPAPPPPVLSGTLTPGTAATFASTDGRVELVVPAGAAATGAQVSLNRVSRLDEPPLPWDWHRVGDMYRLTVTDQAGNPVRQFPTSLTLALAYDRGMLPLGTREEDLRVFYWDETYKAWIALPTRLDRENRRVLASVDHLTVFALLSAPDLKLPTDIAGHWAESHVLRLFSLRAVTGFEDQTFRPDQRVTRLQFTVMLARALGLRPVVPADLPFKDTVPEWAAGYVAAALRAGLVSGFADGTFRGDDPITREQLAAMVVRAAGTVARQPLNFVDAHAISEWARESVEAAVTMGIVKGFEDGTFRPQGTATRAQAATMTSRLLDWMHRRR